MYFSFNIELPHTNVVILAVYLFSKIDLLVIGNLFPNNSVVGLRHICFHSEAQFSQKYDTKSILCLNISVALKESNVHIMFTGTSIINLNNYGISGLWPRLPLVYIRTNKVVIKAKI